MGLEEFFKYFFVVQELQALMPQDVRPSDHSLWLSLSVPRDGDVLLPRFVDEERRKGMYVICVRPAAFDRLYASKT